MSVCYSFLGKSRFFKEFVYGKYSEVGGGNLKNKIRKTLLCACV